jgi:LmbE family N-acetylglucosaminyl deacetylase
MLQRLNVLGSVLMIGAHDDDDDTQLLAYLSGELHLRTGYLSLARGSGAQNRIGPEQGEAIGVLLTQEALAARRLQNVEQYYTRAFDFGFSKTLQETMERWDRPDIMSDIVWILRTLRPDIVIIRYSGTPRDGHGNHQASAVLARRAILAAADPSQFPEHLKFTPAWRPARVFDWSATTQPNAVSLEIGGYNPSLGRSYGEIAALSRSAFRSQAMGSVPTPNARRAFLIPRDANKGAGLLDGIDSTWSRVEGGKTIGATLAAALRNFDADHPERSLPALLAAREQVQLLSSKSSDAWFKFKIVELDETIAQCAGLWIRATAQSEVVTPGDVVRIATEVVNRMPSVLDLLRVTLQGPADEMELLPSPIQLAANRLVVVRGEWTVPVEQPVSQPYWLVKRDGDTAVVPNQTLVGRAESPPLLRVRFQLHTADGTFEITRPIRYLHFEPGEGASSRPLVVAPPVTLRPSTRVVIFPEAASKQLSLRLTANRDDTSGAVRLDLPDGWKSDPTYCDFRIVSAGQSVDVTFTINPPIAEADITVAAIARINGREIALDQTVVDYPHIERNTFFPSAAVRLVRVPIQVRAKRIGYVMGTGDEMPSALEQLGCEVASLSAQNLAESDLTKYDAIVLGIRAYNVRPDVHIQRERLKAYVQKGGTLIMQYTVSPQGPNTAVEVPDLGPYPFRVGAARVTVETSPVTFLQPAHLLLKTPNAITAQDFAGWVQERGLHFANQWDSHYETPLETHDPGEAPLPGGLLFARYGEGAFIYTSYAWFRQLPVGVPGAYRIFANLLSAGNTEK